MQSRSKHIQSSHFCQPLFEGIFTTTSEWVTNPIVVVVVVVINSPNIGTPRIEWNKVKC